MAIGVDMKRENIPAEIGGEVKLHPEGEYLSYINSNSCIQESVWEDMKIQQKLGLG